MRPLFATALLALCPVAASQADGVPGPPPAELTVIPDGGFFAVSPNGGAATGALGDELDGGAQRWFSGPSFDPIPGIGITGEAIADGGLVVLATTSDPVSGYVRAARWTLFGGWSVLPGPVGVPDDDVVMFPGDMSAGGSVIVGRMRTDPLGPSKAYRWTSAGTEELSVPPFTSESAAYAVSHDGQVIGGQIAVTNPITSETSVAPCLFRPGSPTETLLPLEITSTTPINILRATVIDVDDDGDTALGVDVDGAPFVWREGVGVTWLPGSADGALTPGGMRPMALGDDGSFVIGTTSTAFGGFNWLWTPQTGTIGFDTVLDAFDLTADLPAVGTPHLIAASADGTRIAGFVLRLEQMVNFRYDAIAVDIPSPATYGAWDDLGGAKGIPFGPTPQLRGEGLQVAGTPTRLEVDFAQPYSGALIVGFSELSAPFKGGVLVPQPDVIVNLPFSLGGTSTFAFDWPDGIPAGTSLWYQAWMPNASVGFVATNALRSTTH